MKKLLCTFVVLLASLSAFSQKCILENSITKDKLATVLSTDYHWVNYPSYQDREAWSKVATREIRERIIKEAEKTLKNHVWKPDLATDYLAYKRTGQILTGRGNHKALLQLTIAELIEGKGRFMDAIINGAWFLCETSWVHSAHAYFQKDQSGLPDPNEPTVELVVADIGAQMAWTYHFFKDEFNKVSPLIAKRIKNTVRERLIEPYFSRTTYWWMGLHGEKNVNNWNIWINYNTLQAVMLLEDDQEKKADEVYRLMYSVDRYIDVQNQDGACEEGPTYWGHAGANLIKFLDLLYRVTDGNVDVFGVEKIQNIGKYIYRVNVCDSYFVNFSDASAICKIDVGAVYNYGKRMNDNVMKGFAADFSRKTTWTSSFYRGNIIGRVLDDMMQCKEILDYPSTKVDFLSYYFKNSQLCVARDDKDNKKGLFFAAHGSHNNVPHNHNDVGSCMLYYNGEPVLIDVGVGTYNRKTFSSQRYTIWTMQSGYHNLPTINGQDQKNGAQYKASNVSFKDSRRNASFTLDIAKAYTDEAQVNSWVRNYQLKRGKSFVVTDKWSLKAVKGETVLNFMTYQPIEKANGNLYLSNGTDKIQVVYNKKQLEPTIEPINFTDGSLKRVWKTGTVYRLRFTVKDMTAEGETQISFKPIK